MWPTLHKTSPELPHGNANLPSHGRTDPRGAHTTTTDCYRTIQCLSMKIAQRADSVQTTMTEASMLGG